MAFCDICALTHRNARYYFHDVTAQKEQSDEFIRRYADLLKRQNDVKPKSGPKGGTPKGVASQIAGKTGLSTRTVQRMLNPPRRPVSSIREPCIFQPSAKARHGCVGYSCC